MGAKETHDENEVRRQIHTMARRHRPPRRQGDGQMDIFGAPTTVRVDGILCTCRDGKNWEAWLPRPRKQHKQVVCDSLSALTSIIKKGLR